MAVRKGGQKRARKAPGDERAQIARLWREFERTLRGFSDRDRLNFLDACKLGKYLMEMKKILGYGAWGPWEKRKAKELDWSPRSFQRWMRVAKAHEDGRLRNVRGLEDAYSALNEPRGGEQNAGSGRAPVSRFTSLRVAAAKSKLDALFEGHPTVPTLEVQSLSVAGVRQGLAKALAKHASKIKTDGAVIIIKPAAETVSASNSGGSNRRK